MRALLFARPSKNCSVLRNFFVVTVALTAFFSESGDVKGQSRGVFSFDSGSCHEDTHATIYVTLYGTVFRLPMGNLHSIASVGPSGMHLVPPADDPDEPLGCPDNPLPGSTFRISVPLPNDLPHLASPVQSRSLEEAVVPVQRLALRAVRSGYVALQDTHQAAAERHCETGDVRTLTPNLRECLIEPNGAFDRVQWSGSYVANPEVHTIPSGEPFVVSCRTSLPIRHCEVMYKLHDNVNIDYNVDITVMPPENFIDADVAIREALADWLVTLPPSSQP